MTKSNKRKKLAKLAKELKESRDSIMRKYLLEMALFHGVVRIVTKRKALPSLMECKRLTWMMEAVPCTTYQAYELVDDRVNCG